MDGLYYHFAFQNFRIRDMTTHPDDRRSALVFPACTHPHTRRYHNHANKLTCTSSTNSDHCCHYLREFMANLGFEDDPRLVRIFNEFDRKKDEGFAAATRSGVPLYISFFLTPRFGGKRARRSALSTPAPHLIPHTRNFSGTASRKQPTHPPSPTTRLDC